MTEAAAKPESQNPSTPEVRDLAHSTFGIEEEAARSKWPKRGRIVCRSKRSGEVVVMGGMIFSIEYLRDVLRAGVRTKSIYPADATRIEAQARDAGLPERRTRFDRLSRGRKNAESMGYIDAITGTTPLAPGAGPARFERCTDGACGLTRCQEAPTHGVLRATNIAEVIAGPSFSTAEARSKLARSIEDGLIIDDEEMSILEQIDALGRVTPGIIMSDLPTREDQILNAGHKAREQVLYVHLGLVTPTQGARLEPCGDPTDADARHVHLYFFDDVRVVEGPLFTKHQINTTLDLGLKKGLIDEPTAARLRTETEALDLPAGSENNDPANEKFKRLALAADALASMPNGLQELLKRGMLLAIDGEIALAEARISLDLFGFGRAR